MALSDYVGFDAYSDEQISEFLTFARNDTERASLELSLARARDRVDGALLEKIARIWNAVQIYKASATEIEIDIAREAIHANER